MEATPIIIKIELYDIAKVDKVRSKNLKKNKGRSYIDGR